MKLYDKIILVILVAIFVITYVAADIAFEMTTDNNLFAHGAWVYAITLCITAYYCFKIYGKTKWTTYLSLPFINLFFWLGALNTISNLNLLYHAAFDEEKELVVQIQSIKKVFSKSSFTHTQVVIPYDGRDIGFETSRINFFALEHKNSIKVMIGRAGEVNYYITKVYLKSGEKSEARYKYLKDWWNRNWFWPLALLGFILFVVLSIKFGKPRDAIYRYEVKKKKPVSFWRAMAIIMVVLLTVMLVLYLGLIAYVYLVHGGCSNCRLWGESK